MSTKYQQKKVFSSKQRDFRVSLCPTCKNTGFILGTDEIDHTEKMFIEECPDCNS
jgi:hypothetical protein